MISQAGGNEESGGEEFFVKGWACFEDDLLFFLSEYGIQSNGI